MPAIRINSRLSIVTGDPQGIIINCFAGSDAGVLEIFNVTLFPSSVKSMLEDLKQGKAWEAGDRGLAVSAELAEITLTFRMQGPPFGEVDVVLGKEDARRFLEAMSEVAEGS